MCNLFTLLCLVLLVAPVRAQQHEAGQREQISGTRILSVVAVSKYWFSPDNQRFRLICTTCTEREREYLRRVVGSLECAFDGAFEWSCEVPESIESISAKHTSVKYGSLIRPKWNRPQYITSFDLWIPFPSAEIDVVLTEESKHEIGTDCEERAERTRECFRSKVPDLACYTWLAARTTADGIGFCHREHEPCLSMDEELLHICFEMAKKKNLI
jgi:hypothetical protein